MTNVKYILILERMGQYTNFVRIWESLTFFWFLIPAVLQSSQNSTSERWVSLIVAN
jgi:hypothetical protein